MWRPVRRPSHPSIDPHARNGVYAPTRAVARGAVLVSIRMICVIIRMR